MSNKKLSYKAKMNRGWKFDCVRRRWIKPKVQALVTPRTEPRKVVISFRLRQSEVDMLLKNLPVAGLRTVKQYIRKLAIDYGLGRIVYVDPLDGILSHDSRSHIADPDYRIEDGKFRQALISFLGSAKNWNKLRFYMLRAGWPKELLARYESLVTDADKLGVAREVLKSMAK